MLIEVRFILWGEELVSVTGWHFNAFVNARAAKCEYIVVINADLPFIDKLHRAVTEQDVLAFAAVIGAVLI